MPLLSPDNDEDDRGRTLESGVDKNFHELLRALPVIKAHEGPIIPEGPVSAWESLEGTGVEQQAAANQEHRVDEEELVEGTQEHRVDEEELVEGTQEHRVDVEELVRSASIQSVQEMRTSHYKPPIMHNVFTDPSQRACSERLSFWEVFPSAEDLFSDENPSNSSESSQGIRVVMVDIEPCHLAPTEAILPEGDVPPEDQDKSDHEIHPMDEQPLDNDTSTADALRNEVDTLHNEVDTLRNEVDTLHNEVGVLPTAIQTPDALGSGYDTVAVKDKESSSLCKTEVVLPDSVSSEGEFPNHSPEKNQAIIPEGAALGKSQANKKVDIPRTVEEEDDCCTDEKEGPHTDEKEGPPTDEKGHPPTDEKGRPPTDEKGRPPTDEKGRPPTDEKEGPRTDEKGGLYTDEKGDPPTDEKRGLCTDEKGGPSTDEKGHSRTDKEEDNALADITTEQQSLIQGRCQTKEAITTNEQGNVLRSARLHPIDSWTDLNSSANDHAIAGDVTLEGTQEGLMLNKMSAGDHETPPPLPHKPHFLQLFEGSTQNLGNASKPQIEIPSEEIGDVPTSLGASLHEEKTGQSTSSGLQGLDNPLKDSLSSAHTEECSSEEESILSAEATIEGSKVVYKTVKHSEKKSSSTLKDMRKLGVITDTVQIPPPQGKEPSKTRVLIREDGIKCSVLQLGPNSLSIKSMDTEVVVTVKYERIAVFQCYHNLIWLATCNKCTTGDGQPEVFVWVVGSGTTAAYTLLQDIKMMINIRLAACRENRMGRSRAGPLDLEEACTETLAQSHPTRITVCVKRHQNCLNAGEWHPWMLPTKLVISLQPHFRMFPDVLSLRRRTGQVYEGYLPRDYHRYPPRGLRFSSQNKVPLSKVKAVPPIPFPRPILPTIMKQFKGQGSSLPDSSAWSGLRHSAPSRTLSPRASVEQPPEHSGDDTPGPAVLDVLSSSSGSSQPRTSRWWNRRKRSAVLSEEEETRLSDRMYLTIIPPDAPWVFDLGNTDDVEVDRDCDEMENDCDNGETPLSDGKETPSLSDGRKTPSLSDGRKTPSLSDGGETPSLSDGKETPSLSDGGEEPSLSDSGEKPSLSDGGETPSFSNVRKSVSFSHVTSSSPLTWSPFSPSKTDTASASTLTI